MRQFVAANNLSAFTKQGEDGYPPQQQSPVIPAAHQPPQSPAPPLLLGIPEQIPQRLPLVLNLYLQPWERLGLLVPGVAPLGEAICDDEVIRQFCNCRNYILTSEAVDRAIPTVRRALE